jgi:NAD(P)-dependent dehydrogenase (short-subunit alcohol dehydrogenase family)
MLRLLEDKVAIVTGASSGNGRGIALAFAQHGARVVCADMRPVPNPDGYEPDIEYTTVELIEKMEGAAVYLKADVSQQKDMQNLVAGCVERYGRLDIMVNNAGIYIGLAPIVDENEKDYDRVMNINTKGVWLGCREAIRQFMRQGNGGKIVNISSIGGIAGLVEEPAYCASKGAVVNLTRQLALDYSRYRINVNCICPGYIQTAMCREMFDDESILKAVKLATPYPRLGLPEDIANAAVFLSSNMAEWVTGSILVVDGGWSAGEHFFPE